MLFYIVLVLPTIMIIASFSLSMEEGNTPANILLVVGGVSFVPCMLVSLYMIGEQHRHLRSIKERQAVVASYEKTYQEEVDLIMQNSPPSMSAASKAQLILEARSDLRPRLASAKADLTSAVHPVEQVRHSLMSGVISFAGDYK